MWRPPQELIDSYSSGIEKVLQYQFKRRGLLQEALTHTSWPDATQQVSNLTASRCEDTAFSFQWQWLVQRTYSIHKQCGCSVCGLINITVATVQVQFKALKISLAVEKGPVERKVLY